MNFSTQKRQAAFLILPQVLLLLLIGILPISSIQAQIILSIEKNVEIADDGLIVDITAENFKDMAAMQFTLNWDVAVLELEEVLNFQLEGLNENSFNQNFSDQGDMPLAWVDPSVQGVSVENGSVLFSIKFNILSSEPTDIYIDGSPTAIEFVSVLGENLELISTPTRVQTDGQVINGKVFIDGQGDCVFQEGEAGLSNWMVQISDTTKNYYKRTNTDGEFAVFLPIGTYSVTLVLPENNYWKPCDTEQQIEITENRNEAATLNMGVNAGVDCSALSVDISTAFLRRCFQNTYQVAFANAGTIDAIDAYVLVALPAEMLFLSSEQAYTQLEDNTIRFDLGTIPFNTANTFNFTITLDCDNTELGQTHCVSAKIFPDEICTSSEQWSKANLTIEGTCEKDEVQFIIKNIGEGDMANPAQFVIFEDMIMLRQQNESFQLKSGQTFDLNFPANGSTYRLATEQVPFHPTSQLVVDAIEGCGVNSAGSFTKGIVNVFELGDESPFEDVDCQENIGAFDPNDKRAYPTGYGEQHYLEQNKSMTYHIRFQNTGTDTAFNIVVLDTLSVYLDVATFEPLAASHDYEVQILEGNILQFKFDDILLVDSVKNEALSHGFIRFEIAQKADVSLGMVINNSAAIYFDFNEPVITNTTFYTIGEQFLNVEIRTDVHSIPTLKMSVAPNPFSYATMITIDKEDMQEGIFMLYDLNGRLVKQHAFSNNQIELLRNDLEVGLYLFEVHADGSFKGSGKLSVY